MNLYISILSYLSIGLAYVLLRQEVIRLDSEEFFREYPWMDSSTQNRYYLVLLIALIFLYPICIALDLWEQIRNRFNPPKD